MVNTADEEERRGEERKEREGVEREERTGQEGEGKRGRSGKKREGRYKEGHWIKEGEKGRRQVVEEKGKEKRNGL